MNGLEVISDLINEFNIIKYHLKIKECVVGGLEFSYTEKIFDYTDVYRCVDVMPLYVLYGGDLLPMNQRGAAKMMIMMN